MLEASRVRPPGVEEGASEAGGATGSRQGRRQERAEVEARAELLAELRTPAREIQRQASGGWRERQRAAGAGNVPSLSHSLTPLLLTLMGQLKVGRIL